MSREQRKLDHIKYALKLGDGPLTNGLENVHFVHNCLPELNPQDIVLSSQFGGIFFLSPFLINAVTGGADAVTEINRRLARAAKKAGAAIAVGSQYGSVKNKTNYQSYEVVREEYPDGIVFANTSALATPEEALEAVRMLDADALQIHLNPAQELIMPEGDRDFKGLFANMQRILDKCPVPVIVKETGCGMAAAACGGIRSGLDAAKALALGADIAGMAGNVLEAAVNKGEDAAAEIILQAEEELRMLMLLTGSSDIKSLRAKPLYFTGSLLDFMQCRGWEPAEVARSRR